jgi:dTMP kinase
VPGIFITFEGSEGCGKSTQFNLLADRLRDAGASIVTAREPGGTAAGEEIRRLLQFSREGVKLSAEAELLLFAASRAQLVREVIAPALIDNKIVLCDRFLDSTAVYQGVARGLDAGAVRAINAFAVGATMPDMTLLFDLPSDVARARMLRRPRPVGQPVDRMESEPPEFYENVRAGYLALANDEPGRFVVVDANPGKDEVAQTVWNLVTPKIHGFIPANRA